jgi:hypothetical protein
LIHVPYALNAVSGAVRYSSEYSSIVFPYGSLYPAAILECESNDGFDI